MRQHVLLVSVVLLVASLFGQPAQAVSSSATVDTEGLWPAVGALVGHQADGSLGIACSGFLIARDVMVTAGHCTEGLSAESLMPFATFEPFNESSPDLNLLVPVTDLVTHPAFDPAKVKNDLGVAILDWPDSLTPPEEGDLLELPELGELAGLRNSDGLPVPLTHVTYGVVVDPTPPGPWSFIDDGQRRYMTERLVNVTADYVRVNRNKLCSHDSGSPHLFPGSHEAIGVTSLATCADGGGWTVRLDTGVAQDFLDDYMN